MNDKELITIAENTAKILTDSKCGMEDVVNLIKLMSLQIQELQKDCR